MGERIYDVIVIGGGPSGLTSGIYGGRAKLDVLIIDKDDFGGQIKLTDEVVNYPGINSIKGKEIVEMMKKQTQKFGVSFVHDEVIKLELDGDIKKVITKLGEYKGLSIIIASGITHKKLNFIGEDEFLGKGVSYCAICDGEFFKDKDIFVVGAGFVAAEESIFLTRYGKKVHILAREPEFTCAKTIADKVLKNPKIEVKFNTEIISAEGDNLLRKIKMKNNVTGEITEVVSENNENIGLFIFIGFVPQTDIYKGIIELTEEGYIKTNEYMETNVERVYAVGDIRPKELRQLVTAVSDGGTAISRIEKYIFELRNKLNLPKVEREDDDLEENGILDNNMKKQIVELTKRFKTSLNLVMVKGEDLEKSRALEELLRELSSLTEKIKVFVYERSSPEINEKFLLERLPAVFILNKDNEYSRIKYSTIPLEHELNSFMQALYNIAGPGDEVKEELLERIDKIEKKINVQIGVSLKCTRCPDTVQATQFIVSRNKNVSVEIIDVLTHKEFKKKHDIVGVPAIVVNEKNIYFGQMSLEEMIEILEKQ
ncbi:FAD-dependent oxidoreductase [Fusobacterium sp. FSA-380-WT-3A]|uniref:FAD-dependent oxidoreductase n=1 Tax=Fusobacterium sp. FSA-380-WT-3A TaxID=2725304 RepID=UPI0014769F30|nr:FAD-dependent oxidoreductase [Fusobacterium sp. FSA-380-WT-3A]NME35659.1 FAD-dependent oxidoreductase [Fusobacterium sp. FSA-380-WT-3A]